MKLKRTIFWGVGVIAVLTVALYAELVREMTNYAPFFLVPCVDHDMAWRSWTCKQVLRYDSLTPDQVAKLNRQAGVLFPAQIKDAATADEMVSLFIKRGVDINAGDWWFVGNGRTALQTLATAGNVDRVQMLLRHGARANVADRDGHTALDLARLAQHKFPGEASRAEVLRLLEEAEKQQSAQK
jgi:hypothetical protein